MTAPDGPGSRGPGLVAPSHPGPPEPAGEGRSSAVGRLVAAVVGGLVVFGIAFGVTAVALPGFGGEGSGKVIRLALLAMPFVLGIASAVGVWRYGRQARAW